MTHSVLHTHQGARTFAPQSQHLGASRFTRRLCVQAQRMHRARQLCLQQRVHHPVPLHSVEPVKCGRNDAHSHVRLAARADCAFCPRMACVLRKTRPQPPPPAPATPPSSCARSMPQQASDTRVLAPTHCWTMLQRRRQRPVLLPRLSSLPSTRASHDATTPCAVAVRVLQRRCRFLRLCTASCTVRTLHCRNCLRLHNTWHITTPLAHCDDKSIGANGRCHPDVRGLHSSPRTCSHGTWHVTNLCRCAAPDIQTRHADS